MSGTQARVARSVAAIAVLAALAMTIPSAEAQDPEGEDNQPPIELIDVNKVGCEFQGRQAMCDGFYWGGADATFADLGATQDGVRLDLSADFDSTFFLDVIEGATTGTWNIHGDWHMIFSGEVTGIANVTMTGTGEASGDAAEFRVAGTEVNEGLVTFPGSTFPISNSGALAPVTVEVTGGNCVEVTGEWRLSWASLASEVGWSGVDSISGGFTAIRQEQFDVDTANDLLDGVADGTTTDEAVENARLPDLVKEFAAIRVQEQRILTNYWASEDPASNDLLRQVMSLVLEYERVAALAKNASACELEINAGLLSQFAGWPARTLANWSGVMDIEGVELSGSVLLEFTRLSVRTGAIGAGSSLPASSQKRLKQGLTVQLQKVLERTNERVDLELRSPTRADAIESLQAARAALAANLAIEVHGRLYATDEPHFVEDAQSEVDVFDAGRVKELEFEVDDDDE